MNTIITKQELPKLTLVYDELKSVVIECIQKLGDSFQFVTIISNVATFINNKNYGFEAAPYTSYENKLDQSDQQLIREIIWDLIIQRLLSIGDYHESNWPWLSVTQYGQKVFATSQSIPHDPSRYIERVKEEIPNIDSVILIYLSESINTYNINQLLSASIALGCASEKALLLLIEKYQDSFDNTRGRERFEQKVKNRLIKIQFDEFQKDFKRIVGNLPREYSDNHENILLGVFEMFRNHRNSAGHPSGISVAKEMIFANLQVFIPYCKRIYAIISYLKQISISKNTLDKVFMQFVQIFSQHK